MDILVILGHPRSGSFNHAIADTVCATARRNGHRAILRDLYAEHFDPCLPTEEIPQHGPVPDDIRQQCRELQDADGIVVVHPNWWGAPPAVMKGWIDRVVRPGVAYRFQAGDNGEGVPIGLLKATVALVFNTSNTPDDREAAVFGDPLEALWGPCVFRLCGVSTVHRRMFGVTLTSTPAQRRGWLDEVAAITSHAFPSSVQTRPV